jgi:type IV secretory pathway VirB2 component (pilin)
MLTCPQCHGVGRGGEPGPCLVCGRTGRFPGPALVPGPDDEADEIFPFSATEGPLIGLAVCALVATAGIAGGVWAASHVESWLYRVPLFIAGYLGFGVAAGAVIALGTVALVAVKWLQKQVTRGTGWAEQVRPGRGSPAGKS